MSGNRLTSSILTLFKECVLITIGTVIYALGWAIFLLPNNLIGGGASGFASIIQYATNIPMGVTYLVVNVVLLILGTKILGTAFSGKTIYAIVMCSIMLSIVPKMVPVSFIENFALPNGKLICTILGGVLTGIGIGLPISQGGSTGGTDIAALIWCKYHSASPGRVILVIDAAIILSSLLIPSYTESGAELPMLEKIAIMVFGLIQVTVNGYVIDLYLSGTKQSVQVFIFTKHIDRMADALVFGMKGGVTVLSAKGWYSKEERNVLLVVRKKTDLNLLLRYVKTIDPEAFISVSSVMGVYGQGYDTLNAKELEQSSQYGDNVRS